MKRDLIFVLSETLHFKQNKLDPLFQFYPEITLDFRLEMISFCLISALFCLRRTFDFILKRRFPQKQLNSDQRRIKLSVSAVTRLTEATGIWNIFTLYYIFLHYFTVSSFINGTSIFSL